MRSPRSSAVVPWWHRRLAGLVAAVLAVPLAATVVVSTPAPAQAALPSLMNTYGPGIDPYATYQSQTTCASAVQVGVKDFAAALKAAHPSTNPWTYIRACASGAASEHKDGRAIDWMLDSTDPADAAIANQFIAWLTATDKYGNKHAMARRLGIMYIIWKGQLLALWGGRDAGTWRASSGHFDHIHLSFGWPGALRRTSYFTRMSALCVVGTDGCPVSRLAGPDRYSTAVAVGQEASPDATTVVIASGEQGSLVDGLTAGPLAAAVGGPLLLTQKDVLPAVVAEDLAARGADRAYVVGGPSVVSAAVVDRLRGSGVAVTRLAGASRYETAAAVAARVRSVRGSAVPRTVVASGEDGHLIDALGGGGLAAVEGGVVLLTTRDQLPAATSSALSTVGASAVTVVGSDDVVSHGVQTALQGSGRTVGRAGGVDRFATASAVAALAYDAGVTGTVAVVSGADANMVDAIPAAALRLPMLLTAPTTLPSASVAWISGRSSLREATVVGGASAVGQVVVDQVYLALGAS